MLLNSILFKQMFLLFAPPPTLRRCLFLSITPFLCFEPKPICLDLRSFSRIKMNENNGSNTTTKRAPLSTWSRFSFSKSQRCRRGFELLCIRRDIFFILMHGFFSPVRLGGNKSRPPPFFLRRGPLLLSKPCDHVSYFVLGQKGQKSIPICSTIFPI